MDQPDWMRICISSIERVLGRSRDSEHEYFVGEMEDDLRSKIFCKIATRQSRLIKPDAPISMHCEVPVKQFRKVEDRFRSRELDIAIIDRHNDLQNKKYDAHYYDLEGVIEVKANFSSSKDFHLPLIASLLQSYPNAFAIFAVMYWPTRRPNQTNSVRNLVMQLEKWKAWRDSRVEIVCERDTKKGSDWEGEVLRLNQHSYHKYLSTSNI